MSKTSGKFPSVIGQYQIVDQLAVGGMAEIFLARVAGPGEFERPVVIKRILPHLEENQVFVDMFMDEAKIIAAIRHPNVVQVQELILHEGAHYLVMEFIEGESLGSLMRRLWVRKQPVDLSLAAYIISEACAGLHSAHELTDSKGVLRNVVHRDISPQNIMITYNGVIKILDFGIAKFEGRTAHTEHGQFKGKFSYSSPEQCRCESIDRRADIFALGILLFELCVGKTLFKRSTAAATLQAILFDSIPRPSALIANFPECLDKICQKSLARAPEERYSTAVEMRRELVLAMRNLGGEELEDEVLARFMKSTFADRVDEKRELLTKVCAGSKPDKVTEAEVEKNVEIPSIITTDSCNNLSGFSEKSNKSGSKTGPSITINENKIKKIRKTYLSQGPIILLTVFVFIFFIVGAIALSSRFRRNIDNIKIKPKQDAIIVRDDQLVSDDPDDHDGQKSELDRFNSIKSSECLDPSISLSLPFSSLESIDINQFINSKVPKEPKVSKVVPKKSTQLSSSRPSSTTKKPRSSKTSYKRKNETKMLSIRNPLTINEPSIKKENYGLENKADNKTENKQMTPQTKKSRSWRW